MIEQWDLFLVTFQDRSTECVYGYDEMYATSKAEKQYRRVPKLVQQVDTSRENDQVWITKTFGV